MVNEVKVERHSLIKYFTDDINGLGYKEKGKQSVCKDLFIKSDIIDFLKTPANKKNFEYVLKTNFNNDVDKFYIEYKKHLQKEITSLSTLNVSILLNKEITFKGKSFYLYYKPNLNDLSNSHSKHNIHSVVSQYTHCYLNEDNKKINNFSFKPDLIFFLNGIYFGYLELKFNSNGQSAKEEGIIQIIDKFKTSYEIYEQELDNNVNKELKKHQRQQYRNNQQRFKKEFLKIFYTPIHITSFDSHSLYSIRTFDKIETIINQKDTDLIYGLNEFYEKTMKEFKKYPNDLNKSNQEEWKTLLKNVYSKEMIEREILYYNFTERNMELDSNGRYKSKNEDSFLVTPRPKQKFGADKTISLVKEMIDNETNDSYWIEKIKKQIVDLPNEIQEKVLEERKKFKNGKYVFSVLLAYAAGFGKTNTMGWISLLLKDLLTKEEKYAFDTIYLITDRLELKTQLENKMVQMNVDKGIVEEVKNRKGFEDALVNGKKIIIVNIQKFQTIKDILSSNLLDKLQYQRNAFIIDEIHRSNSGSQHEDMLEMFTEELSKDTDNPNRKKNLVVGLTATPKEETLLRFGEYAGCDGNRVIFRPHDEYTMEESIKDGYTLDFSNSITPYAVQMDFYKNNNQNNHVENDETKEVLKKVKIYENKDRIQAISKIIVNNCLDNVFTQIRGYGKAMLACFSIKSALEYHKQITKYFNEKTNDKEYEKYNDIPIHILYTSSGNDKTIPKVSLLNDGKNEKQIINNFKNKKNGIIIVVDKLQTGFDEPKLHTLFLDKELTGVGAIQTCARVNRTTKNKFNCHIVDFSHNNVNFTTNIPQALEEYKGQLYSKSNIRSPFEDLQDSFKVLKNHHLNKNYRKDYIKHLMNNKTDEVLKVEKNIIVWCNKNKSILKDLLDEITLYFRSINVLNSILDISNYRNKDLEIFYKKVLNIIRTNFNDSGDLNIEEILVDFVDIGKVILIEDEENNSSNNKKNNSNNPKKQKHSSLIDKLLENETIKEDNIKLYKESLKILCEEVVKLGEQSQKDDIKGKILDGTFEEQDLMGLFITLTKKVARRNKDKLSEDFINSVIDFKPNAYEDFKVYVLEKKI